MGRVKGTLVRRLQTCSQKIKGSKTWLRLLEYAVPEFKTIQNNAICCLPLLLILLEIIALLNYDFSLINIFSSLPWRGGLTYYPVQGLSLEISL